MQNHISTEQNIISYEYKVCCFIDVLGFKQHIKGLVDDNDTPNFNAINNLYSSLKKLKELGEDAKFVNLGFEFSQFSDCIVISFNYENGSNLMFILLSLLHAQIELVQNGFLIRGGISIGRLHHSQEFVFGEALVKAYELESNLAKFPRIILHRDVIDICKEFGDHHPTQEEKYLNQIILEDEDGQSYLNYFESAISEFDEPIIDTLTYIKTIHDNFLDGFDYIQSSDPIYEKLNWLNRKVEALKKNFQTPKNV